MQQKFDEGFDKILEDDVRADLNDRNRTSEQLSPYGLNDTEALDATDIEFAVGILQSGATHD